MPAAAGTSHHWQLWHIQRRHSRLLPAETPAGCSAGYASQAAAAAGPKAGPPSAAASLLAEAKACGASEERLQQLARGVAQAAPHLQRQLVGELSGLLEGGGGGGAPSGPLLARVLWVVGQAHACPAAEREHLFQTAMAPAYTALGALPPEDLARLLSTYAASGCRSQELFAAATEFVWEGLQETPPGALADIAAAYASVGHYEDDGDLWRGLAARAVAKVQDFTPDQLGTLLEATARLRFRDGALCTAALAAAAAGSSAWPTRALAQVVWALGWLGHGVGPGEGPRLDRIAAAITTRLRNLMTSTDVARLAAQGSGGGAGDRGGGGGGFLGASSEAAALAASPGGGGGGGAYSWQRQPPGGSGAAAGGEQTVHVQVSVHHQRPRGWAGPLAGGNMADSADSFAPGGPPAFAARPASAAAAAAAAPPELGPVAAAAPAGSAGACVRPALDPPDALRHALSRLAWGYVALGRLPTGLLRETFKLLGSFPPADYSQPQLAMLFEAAARAAEMGHHVGEAHPLLATSARVFVAQAKRAPRLLTLPPDLQPFAFAAWLRGTQHGRTPLAPPPPLARASGPPTAAASSAAAAAWPDQRPPAYSSWKHRDSSATTRAGLEAAIAAGLVAAGLAPSPPSPDAPALTLDGVLAVPLPLERGNGRVAVEALPPEATSVNPPHVPGGGAATRAAMLKYRGWAVAPVVFAEWDEAREGAADGSSGAEAAAGLLRAAVEGAESEEGCGGDDGR